MSKVYSPLLNELIESLTCLPGVGPKSAQRMSMQLLERNREGALALAQALTKAMEGIGHCEQCRSYTEERLCALCQDVRRDDDVLCVVETPADVVAIESSGSFRGRYFVLMGHLSPLDGIGPEELGLSKLEELVKRSAAKELILATNSTVEGEATAYYIAEMFHDSDVEVSRIAHGVPIGGELEYVDGGTLSRALASRRPVDS